MAKVSVNKRYELLLIGGSAGSLEVLLQLLPTLKKDFSLAIVLVLHRRPGESLLVDLLNDKTVLQVKEAEEKESLKKGIVYVAPADYHLLIEEDKTLSLDYSEKVNFSRPSIDVTFETAAEVFGPLVVALLLSGANSDGAAGIEKVHALGGLTIVQDPAEAAVSLMPEQAIKTTKVDYIAKTAAMIELINGLSNPSQE